MLLVTILLRDRLVLASGVGLNSERFLVVVVDFGSSTVRRGDVFFIISGDLDRYF